MIAGNLAKLHTTGKVYGEVLKRCFAYLEQTDFTALAEGRYELDDGIFALVQQYEPKTFAASRPEAHVKYADIQYIVSGSEQIGWSLLTDASHKSEDCLAERDACFFDKVENEAMLTLTSGMGAVFFPCDVHRPCVSTGQSGQVKKVVVKIPMSLF